jgi:hypothetical protein
VGIDGVTLVQECVPARDDRVLRCETLNGKFLYAIALEGAGSTFDLCPADVCLVDKPSIAITAFTPPPDIVRAVEAIAQAAHLDVGGDGKERTSSSCTGGRRGCSDTCPA